MGNLVLLIPEKADPEREAVAQAWEAADLGRVLRIGRFWDPPSVEKGAVRVYGNDTFCLVLAEKLELTLVTPDDHLIARAPEHLLQRQVGVSTLGAVSGHKFPAFVKPIIPKQFTASVYDSAAALEAASRGLASNVEILVSEVVEFEAEARTFVLEGQVRSCAIYEGTANQDEAARFAEEVCRAMDLPTTCVVDVGKLAGGEWALVEFNATWGARLNGCDATRVVDCIVAATR